MPNIWLQCFISKIAHVMYTTLAIAQCLCTYLEQDGQFCFVADGNVCLCRAAISGCIHSMPLQIHGDILTRTDRVITDSGDVPGQLLMMAYRDITLTITIVEQ